MPSSPMKIPLPCPVSLDEFCDIYGFGDEVKARLDKLGVQPGDRRVERLEREEWQGFGGFSRLAWEDFLQKHKSFVSDVLAGNWN